LDVVNKATNTVTDSDRVDIRIRDVPEDLRNRFKAASAREGKTYEEMLERLTAAYENRPDLIEQASRERNRDR
jgi:hypothetical protein